MRLKITCKAKDLKPHMRFILSNYKEEDLVVDMKLIEDKKIPVEW